MTGQSQPAGTRLEGALGDGKLVSQIEMQQLTPALPLRERVFFALQKMMIDGILFPGQHLAEEELARQLGVSRNPVREALQRLGHEGYVDLQPKKGAFVQVPSTREIDEVFQTRALLEGETARIAAAAITEEQLAALSEIVQLGHSALATQNAVELLELNERFHTGIVDAAGNSVIAGIMDGLAKRIRWYFSSVVVERSPGSWQEHLDIYHALLARNGEEAGRLASRHVEHTWKTLRTE